jgi:formylglycine-generating enzyme required for sulfatase activity
MILIPAGEFMMGDRRVDEFTLRTFYLDAFYIDRYEVTTEQYVTFINTLGQHKWACGGADCLLMEHSYIQWENDVYKAKTEHADYPASATWYGAQAYCLWLGKRLPTEAEWEKAARGTDGWRFPWGNERMQDMSDLYLLTHIGGHSADVGPYGVVDMLSNAREWVADWYSHDYHQQAPYRNPTGPLEAVEPLLAKVIKSVDPSDLGARSQRPPDLSVGFRCAYTP